MNHHWITFLLYLRRSQDKGHVAEIAIRNREKDCQKNVVKVVSDIDRQMMSRLGVAYKQGRYE